MLRMNLDGLLLMCWAGSDLMRKSGYERIVNITSNSLHAGTPNMAHYLASKGGVLFFIRAFATQPGMPCHRSQLCGAGSDRYRATDLAPRKGLRLHRDAAGGQGSRTAAARCPGP
ncbi:MAG: SDR family oxidoreductase [Rhodospirillales bacterium]|nr:SDR family oxidoreductase [Rhodospirillales bacterium]